MTANPQDDAREKLLRHLYAVHRDARGRRSISVSISDLKKEMKTAGLSQSAVTSNLDYLIQKRWVAEVIEERKFTTPRGTEQSSQKITYKISDTGIVDRLEQASAFQRNDAATINVTNINGVTVVGQGNIVNASFADAHRALNELEHQVADSDILPEERKLEVLSDISTVKAQIAKPSPNQLIVKTAWKAIENAVIGSDFVELVVRVGRLLSGLL